MGYDAGALSRFVALALPLLMLLLALFGTLVVRLDLVPGDAVRLALFDHRQVPAAIALGAWLLEAAALLGLFLLVEGRSGSRLLDGLLCGWIAWTFRGPLLVVTMTVAAGQPRAPWWRLALGWWLLYTFCGLTLGWLARGRSRGALRAGVD